MTRFALCIARSSNSRTIASEPASLRHRRRNCVPHNEPFWTIIVVELAVDTTEDRYFAHRAWRGAVQLLLAPDAARLRPGAEAPRQLTRMKGGTPPDILSHAAVRGARAWQASRRVGFGTRGLAAGEATNVRWTRKRWAPAAPTFLRKQVRRK